MVLGKAGCMARVSFPQLSPRMCPSPGLAYWTLGFYLSLKSCIIFSFQKHFFFLLTQVTLQCQSFYLWTGITAFFILGKWNLTIQKRLCWTNKEKLIFLVFMLLDTTANGKQIWDFCYSSDCDLHVLNQYYLVWGEFGWVLFFLLPLHHSHTTDCKST